MRIGTQILASIAALVPTIGSAFTFEFPANSSQSVELTTPLGSYAVPVAAWRDGAVESTIAEGQVIKQAWRINSQGLTTLQLLEPLRAQLASAGYETLFECETDICGGFDFRYGTDVIAEPQMHIDLGDFRFLSASNRETKDHISLLVSRSANAGFIQVTRVGPIDMTALTTATTTKGSLFSGDLPAMTLTISDLSKTLEGQGFVILEDLNFPTGTSTLGTGEYASLSELADYLNANTTRTVALVGHTDAKGSLSQNVALSKKRAASVVAQLVDNYGVNRKQLSAEGMGFLSPRATNLTGEGRTQNRRVEVILTSTQ